MVVVDVVCYQMVLDAALLLDLDARMLEVLVVEPRVLLDVVVVCLFSLLLDVDELLLSIVAATAAV